MNTKPIKISAADHLLKYGIKPSLQRIAIMDYLLTHRTHPTADEIYSALYPAIPTLSRTTVYNTLKLFSEKGAALTLTIEDKNARFDGDTSKHAHFICLGCGAIYDLPLSQRQIEALEIDSAELSFEEVQVYYKGLCKKCKTKQHN